MKVAEFVQGLSEEDRIRFRQLIEKARQLEFRLQQIQNNPLSSSGHMKNHLEELTYNLMLLFQKAVKLKECIDQIVRLAEQAKFEEYSGICQRISSRKLDHNLLITT